MNTKDEKSFLSIFEKLVENKDNSKYIDSIIEFIDNCNVINIENQLNGEVQSENLPKPSSKKKQIIRNRKYLYKLVKNEDDYLQYTLDRLVKGISSGVKNSRTGFGSCLGQVLHRFKDSIDFENLIKLFLNVYASSSDFVLNKQIKYVFLGRLEVIYQLYKVEYFKIHKSEHVEKIVEYVWEVYNHKIYLQDSSIILIIMILSDLYNRNKGDCELIKNKVRLEDNNPSMLSLSMFISNLENNVSGLYKGSRNEGDELTVGEVLLRGLDQIKNYYPTLNVYIYFLVERMKSDYEVFEKVINTLNYMMESTSLNSVKVALIAVLIVIFELKSRKLLKVVFDRIDVFLKTIVKYYRYANSTNIKKFINKYITLISEMFNERVLLNSSGSSNTYINVYNNLTKMDSVSEDVMIYVKMHKSLLNGFFSRFNSESKIMNEEEDKGSLESEIRYELLMRIGKCVSVNSINIFNPVIKSILFSISVNSKYSSEELVNLNSVTRELEEVDVKKEKSKNGCIGSTSNDSSKVGIKRLRESEVCRKNEQLCMKLLEELKKDDKMFKYMLYLVKLLVIDNFYNLTLLSSFISRECRLELNKAEDKMDIESEERVEGLDSVNGEDELFEVYSTLLVKYLGNLGNKFSKLSVNELNSYYTILVSQVKSFYQKKMETEADNSVLAARNKFLVLVKEVNDEYNTNINGCRNGSSVTSGISGSNRDEIGNTGSLSKNTLMNLIVMTSVAICLVLVVKYDVVFDKMLLDYVDLLYKYFNNNLSVEEKRQLHYILINYMFNNASLTTCEGGVEQVKALLETLNGLIWGLLVQELDSEFCKTILSTTLTCDLSAINSLSNVDYDMEEESGHSSDEEEDLEQENEDVEYEELEEDLEQEDEESVDSSDEEEEKSEDEDNYEIDEDISTDKEEEESEDDEHQRDGEEEDWAEEDVVLTDYDKIYDELTTKSEFNFDRKKIKEEHDQKEEHHKIKERGYNLLLNLVENNSDRIESVFGLNDLLELVDDYVKSTKFNYNSKIVKLIKELSKTKQVSISGIQANEDGLVDSEGQKRVKNNNINNKDVDVCVELVNKLIHILLYNKNIKSMLVNVVEIMCKIVNNKQLATVSVNYMAFLVLTKRTAVNVNTVVELFRKHECILNMYKILEVLSKNVMKSQLLTVSSRLIEMRKYYEEVDCCGNECISKMGSESFKEYVCKKHLNQDLEIILNHVMQFNEEVEGVNSPKRVKIEENKKKNKREYSSQYVKTMVVNINSMYHYVNNDNLSTSETDEIFNKIRDKVKSIENKHLKKYFNNIAIK